MVVRDGQLDAFLPRSFRQSAMRGMNSTSAKGIMLAIAGNPLGGFSRSVRLPNCELLPFLVNGDLGR